jgi:peptidoglycan/xylan/chitin deacetylase (PgdA/CDA1 family)
MSASASDLKPQTSNNAKPFASISLDLDNQWSYMKTHGDAGWVTFPSYFDIIVPLILDILDSLALKITFFIVGQDAALKKNHEVLRSIPDRGHEVGNHSFHHEPWLHLYPEDQMKNEILEAEEHIFRATGQRPVGFRGPGFAWSPTLLEVLVACSYHYDASLLPTYLGPLARMYFFWKSGLTPEEKAKRKKLFGSFTQGFFPVKPFLWQLFSGHKVLEIPITTMPIFKTPFHLSYLLYLSRFSVPLMHLYLQTAIALCLITRTAPSFLLHPLDLLSGDQVPELKFFPGMDLSRQRKLELFHQVIRMLSKHYRIVNMSTHADACRGNEHLRAVHL